MKKYLSIALILVGCFFVVFNCSAQYDPEKPHRDYIEQMRKVKWVEVKKLNKFFVSGTIGYDTVEVMMVASDTTDVGSMNTYRGWEVFLKGRTEYDEWNKFSEGVHGYGIREERYHWTYLYRDKTPMRLFVWEVKTLK